MRKSWTVLAAALTLWAVSASGALACRFIPPVDPAAHLARADVAFVGRAMGTRAIPGRKGWIETRFRVRRTLKGRPAAVRVVQQITTTSCSAITYEQGRTTVVLANASEGRLTTGAMLAPQFSVRDYERAARGRPRR